MRRQKGIPPDHPTNLSHMHSTPLRESHLNLVYRRVGKRLLDIAFAAAALLASAPVLLVCGVLIRTTSRGPIFFRQERLGRGGRVFRALKFRTMTDGLRSEPSEIFGRHPEVTLVGHCLRRFKLDELPQLWNVVRGDMSIVGPRPALPGQLEEYDSESGRRLEVRPGLTGLAQVNGNIYLTWPERWAWDVEYVDKMSLRLDLRIIWRTVSVVLRGEERFLSRQGGDDRQ